MESPLDEPELIHQPKLLLLQMAKLQSSAELLNLAVTRLAESRRVALARIWLLKPGDICAACRMRPECPDQSRCLHLVASAGHSATDPGVTFDGLQGAFRRFPLGVRKVGRIAATGEAIEVSDLAVQPDWIVEPQWIRAEGIQGFSGQPLVSRGEVLGVLAVFSRDPIGERNIQWLRMIADHAATALANARAWEEVTALRRQLAMENEYLREEVHAAESFGDMVGQSVALDAIKGQIAMVASTDATVLIQGESGTGKELIARELHQRSGRASRPLIKVNCAAIPRELFDSEFFGHVRGSFSGAVRDRVGRFELADGGTLFLDEIGEVPLDLQSKLLRVLQEGEVQRVGEERARKVNVRVIAATNRDLKHESLTCRFRSDLFYRLSVFPVTLPPLRHRKEDIPLLAEHFLGQLTRRLGRTVRRLTVGNMQQLKRYDWPGNVRELQHVLERAIITSTDGRLVFELEEPASGRPDAPSTAAEAPAPILTATQLRALEADNLRRALREARGRIYGAGGAAALVGLKPTTFASRMKSLGVTAEARA